MSVDHFCQRRNEIAIIGMSCPFSRAKIMVYKDRLQVIKVLWKIKSVEPVLKFCWGDNKIAWPAYQTYHNEQRQNYFYLTELAA